MLVAVPLTYFCLIEMSLKYPQSFSAKASLQLCTHAWSVGMEMEIKTCIKHRNSWRHGVDVMLH